MKRIKTFYPNASHFPSQIVHCVSGKVVRERAQKIKNSWEKNTHTINLLPLSVSQYSYFVPPPLVSSLCIQNTSQGVPKNHIRYHFKTKYISNELRTSNIFNR